MSVTTANLRTNAYGVQPASTGTVSPPAAALAAKAAAQVAAADGSLPASVRAAWAATATAWGEIGASAVAAWQSANSAWNVVWFSAGTSMDGVVSSSASFFGKSAWHNLSDQNTWSSAWWLAGFHWTNNWPTASSGFNSGAGLAARNASGAAASVYQNSQASDFIAGTTTTATDTVSTIDLSTAAGATQALGIVDGALTSISDERAKHGALQSRFETVVQHLKINAENASASVSRIVDADYATETSQLARAQILQQAGTAMVTQANQMSNNVMALLRP